MLWSTHPSSPRLQLRPPEMCLDRVHDWDTQEEQDLKLGPASSKPPARSAPESSTLRPTTVTLPEHNVTLASKPRSRPPTRRLDSLDIHRTSVSNLSFINGGVHHQFGERQLQRHRQLLVQGFDISRSEGSHLAPSTSGPGRYTSAGSNRHGSVAEGFWSPLTGRVLDALLLANTLLALLRFLVRGGFLML